MLTLIYSHTQTRTAPEQNSIINGLIAQVELLWESEPATLNKIKPLLYIFIIPNHVLNCKCVSETHRCPSLLPSLSFPLFLAVSLQQPSPSPYPLPRQLHVSMHVCTHTCGYTFYCCGMCVQPPLRSLIKGKGCVCLWGRGVVWMRKCFWAAAELLCLFAIRSDRQHSHIHHCHLPLDFPLSPSLSSSLPIPCFYLSSSSHPSSSSVFFPAPVKSHILSRVGYLNYLFDTEDITLCFTNSLSLSFSPAPPTPSL